ncbi:MAG: hypothetical protein AAGJ11_15575 [Bacteroidota bacterium]
MTHAIAHLRWLSEKEGGRTTPFSGRRYMAPVDLGEAGTWTLVIDRSGESPREEETVLIHFLMEDAPHPTLQPGVTFDVQEGTRTVAQAEVSEVFELSLAA